MADAGGSYTGNEGWAVEFSSSGSYAFDLSPVTYAWDFGDGGSSTEETPRHMYFDDSDCPVALTVTDRLGRLATAGATVTIFNVAPAVVAGPNISGTVSAPVNLEATFSDPGVLDAPWQVVWDFGDGSGPVADTRGTQGPVDASHAYESSGQFTATVTVTDKDGGVGVVTIAVSIMACSPPVQPIFLANVRLSADGNKYPVLDCQDPNQPGQVTGYNVYRSSMASLPAEEWTLVGLDVVDMDDVTPDAQWVDESGDVSPTGAWYYQVTAYNHGCPAEGPR